MIFGDPTDDTISGSLIWGDRLYGGDGVDTIEGNGGDDYIEGNEGNDVLLSGGSGNDTILGGQGDDTLEGGTGDDTLDGGLDNDTLRGGTGLDRYIARFGADTIEDSDGKGVVEFDGEILVGGLRRNGEPGNVFHSTDGTITYTKSGTDLVVTGSGPLTITNFSSGQLGIRLAEEGSYGATTRSEFLKVDHYEQVGTDSNGNPIYGPVYAPFFDETANNSVGLENPIDTGTTNNLLHAFGGNDVVVSGSGDDQLYGDAGDDFLAGGGGHDRLYGGLNNDVMTGDGNTLFPDDWGNDLLDGGEAMISCKAGEGTTSCWAG